MLSEVRKFELRIKHSNLHSFSDPSIFVCCSVECRGLSLITLAAAYTSKVKAILLYVLQLVDVVGSQNPLLWLWPGHFTSCNHGPCMARTWHEDHRQRGVGGHTWESENMPIRCQYLCRPTPSGGRTGWSRRVWQITQQPRLLSQLIVGRLLLASVILGR